jgi:hypothetical protein
LDASHPDLFKEGFSFKLSLGHSLSHRVRHTARMKTRITSLCAPKPGRTITTFGRAKLVSLRDGSVELRGAEAGDRTAAKEWISLFMHEAVPRFTN